MARNLSAGFTHGYKVVSTWLREYLGKPGRRSSEEEKAKHQSFLTAVATEPGLLSGSSETFPEISPSQPTEGRVEPLGSPRHLTWLLVRDPKDLDQQDQLTLTFIREVLDIDITYGLT